MGDRTHVTLTVLKEHKEQVGKVYGFELDEESRESWGDGSWVDGDTHIHITFEEVNYGELWDLDKLHNAGIAYDSEWEKGDDYSPGVEHCRFTPDGEIRIHRLSEGEENPSINELIKLLDVPEQLVAFIREYVKETTPLPWDNQAEYGRIYRATQLITT